MTPDLPDVLGRAHKHLTLAVDLARAAIRTDPGHALYPNHRADEWVRDALEGLLHD